MGPASMLAPWPPSLRIDASHGPVRRSSPRMHAHALRMRTEQSKDDSLAASVNRRAALVTAAALALELRSPAPAHAAGATLTMTVNTFEGVKGDVGTVLVCVLVCVYVSLFPSLLLYLSLSVPASVCLCVSDTHTHAPSVCLSVWRALSLCARVNAARPQDTLTAQRENRHSSAEDLGKVFRRRGRL